jgi:hypothetical protein
MTYALDSEYWSEHVRQTLRGYDEALLRQVASNLIRPRSQWPVEELIERCATTLDNAVVIDRRLQELEEADRRLLAALGRSRETHWRLGSLLEILAALGGNDGPAQVFRLFQAGLLYPEFGAARNGTPGSARKRLKSFEDWLKDAAATEFAVFACPFVLARSIRCELDLPAPPSQTLSQPVIHEADGFEWILRLAALWQSLAATPVRRTQSGEFFKRDLDRLRSDPLLNSPAADSLAEVPDPALLAMAIGQVAGVALEDGLEIRCGDFSADWDDAAALSLLWKALFRLDTWNPRQAGCSKAVGGDPYPSAYLLAFLFLSKVPEDAWTSPDDIENLVLQNHPLWREDRRRPAKERGWLKTVLLGVAYQFRILQATKGAEGDWLIRLSAWGRWLLGFSAEPPRSATYPQTLLVQPNHEIIVYRQGLTAALIGRLSRFAVWKSFGAACTLQLEPQQAYRALQSGLSVEGILRTLEQHTSHAIPGAVVESLRTWAGKHERITVYSSATLFEFGSDLDASHALARGLAGTRLSDRLLVVVDETGVDFRHFRLTGTRDYSLPPEKCVSIEPDGITLDVDVSKSDLLLEAELQRFAEPIDDATVNGLRRYRLTPESLARARQLGFGADALEQWFQQRADTLPSAAAILIQSGSQQLPFRVRQMAVLEVASEEIADGLEQWPSTRAFIKKRLGPTALAIDLAEAPVFEERLAAIGVTLQIAQDE